MNEAEKRAVSTRKYLGFSCDEYTSSLIAERDAAVRLAAALARHVATVTADRDTSREELVAVTRERDWLRVLVDLHRERRPDPAARGNR